MRSVETSKFLPHNIPRWPNSLEDGWGKRYEGESFLKVGHDSHQYSQNMHMNKEGGPEIIRALTSL